MQGQTRANGRASRAAILDRGLKLSAHGGLPAASIGALATALGMSKSAVFAHFGSKPSLDLALVEAAVRRFEHRVMTPAGAAPEGVARLVALTEAWLAQVTAGDPALEVLTASCPHAFDATRDAVTAWRRSWRATLRAEVAAGVAAGELDAGAPVPLIAFECDAVLFAAARDGDPGDDGAGGHARYAIEHLLRRWSAPSPVSTMSPTP
jgi:AcrR family transcriptional regulator